MQNEQIYEIIKKEKQLRTELYAFSVQYHTSYILTIYILGTLSVIQEHMNDVAVVSA